jgi:hypothetical protein
MPFDSRQAVDGLRVEKGMDALFDGLIGCGEPADKPGSVEGNHSSAAPVTVRL